MSVSMPQAKNPRVNADNASLIRGKGSVQSSLSESSFAIHRRALKINEGEHKKLTLTLKVIDKHGRALETSREKIMGRIQTNLKNLGAYQQVLNSDYNADSFDTLTFGYKLKEAKKDPERLQRFIYETRIYHSGFSMRNLRRQVSRKLIETDPNEKRLKARKKLLENARLQNDLINYRIDRKTSLTKIFENHKKGITPRLPPIKQTEYETTEEEQQLEEKENEAENKKPLIETEKEANAQQ